MLCRVSLHLDQICVFVYMSFFSLIFLYMRDWIKPRMYLHEQRGSPQWLFLLPKMCWTSMIFFFFSWYIISGGRGILKLGCLHWKHQEVLVDLKAIATMLWIDPASFAKFILKFLSQHLPVDGILPQSMHTCFYGVFELIIFNLNGAKEVTSGSCTCF